MLAFIPASQRRHLRRSRIIEWLCHEMSLTSLTTKQYNQSKQHLLRFRSQTSPCRKDSVCFADTLRHLPTLFLRKEVIQPHLPIRLPCYDFTPVISPAFGRSFLAVRSRTSGVTDSHGVTGGVYKTRERIHRDILIHDY